MADIKYKVGDTYKAKYPDAPVSKERQHSVGAWVSVRENSILMAMCEVKKTDANEYEGEIVRVFKTKAPTSPQSTDPRKTGPAANREVKPL